MGLVNARLIIKPANLLPHILSVGFLFYLCTAGLLLPSPSSPFSLTSSPFSPLSHSFSPFLPPLLLGGPAGDGAKCLKVCSHLGPRPTLTSPGWSCGWWREMSQSMLSPRPAPTLVSPGWSCGWWREMSQSMLSPRPAPYFSLSWVVLRVVARNISKYALA